MNTKTTLISYADSNYKKAQKLLSRSAKMAGFDNIIEYGPDDIPSDFRKLHQDIFAYKRGDGLWLWKPYLIKATLDNLANGDILFYCDSGAFFIRKPDAILNKLKDQDIWVSALPLKEKQFTKKECFELMGCSDSYYHESVQISGTFIAFKKTSFVMAFVSEWLAWCSQIRIIAPVDDYENELDCFIAHREDQSVLSILCKKHGLRAWSDPSQYGRLPEKYHNPSYEMDYYGGIPGYQDYPICIIHHRKGNAKLTVILRQLVCAILPREVGIKLIRT